MQIMKRMEGRAGRVLRGLIAAVFGALALALSGCTPPLNAAPGDPIPPEAIRQTASGELAPGDVIAISFPGAPEMNQSQKVRADGKVNLPIIGDVRAAGRSVSSFQNGLAGSYKAHLQDPSVVVSVVTAAAAVYVSGAVGGGGKIPLDRPMSVLEAIMEAGGFAPTANPKKVSVYRTERGRNRQYDLDMSNLSAGAAFYLRPYDVIYVPQRQW